MKDISMLKVLVERVSKFFFFLLMIRIILLYKRENPNYNNRTLVAEEKANKRSAYNLGKKEIKPTTWGKGTN